eukprot:UN12523
MSTKSYLQFREGISQSATEFIILDWKLVILTNRLYFIGPK